MRVRVDNLLPSPQGQGAYLGRLVASLHDWIRSAGRKVNDLADGRISARDSAATAAPTGGEYARGDFITNSEPAELGSAGSKYVVLGWVCTASGNPGTWLECRALTGG